MTIPTHLLPRVRVLITALSAADIGPSPEDLEGAPHLDMWRALLAPECAPILTGNVSGHPILGARMITTSQLVAIDPDAGWARTASRWYRLGMPLTQLDGEARTKPKAEGARLGPAELLMHGYRPINDLARLQGLINAWAQRLCKMHADHIAGP